MALIKCPRCGNDVSTHSTVCLKCGEPVHEEPSTPEQKLKIKERLKRDMATYLIGAGIFSAVTIYLVYIGEHTAYRYFLPTLLVLANLIKFYISLKKYEKE